MLRIVNGLISTSEAAEKLRISVRRVQALIASGRLRAEKIGNRFLIRESDLKALNGRKNGRPKPTNAQMQEKLNAALKKYIGCVSLGPDRSTNRKFLEGFGR